MTISYGLFKSRFKKTIANSIYNEILSNTARYYHFLGKENLWTDFLSPFINSQDPAIGDVPGAPSDNYRYELHVRRDILTVKHITPSDVSYVVPRYDWVSGSVYDMYDDALTASEPAPSGAVRLEDAKFYVLTNDYNVYKCIYNNYGSVSTHQPTGTSPSVFTTTDGYKWKFMYTIPISLRNRFLSSKYMPVTTALRLPFYSDGKISMYTIIDGGSNYTNPTLTVSGNGYLENNPYVIDSLSIKVDRDVNGNIIKTYAGDGYTLTPNITIENPSIISGSEIAATANCTILNGAIDTITLQTAGYGYTADPLPPVITVDPPFSGAVDYSISTNYIIGDIIVYNGIFYEVSAITGNGTTDALYPSVTIGSEVRGEVTLTYIGQQAVVEPIMVKTEAQLTAILGTGGEIVGVTINDGGIGYTNANIQITDSTGSGAAIDVDFNVGNVDTLQANVELSAIIGTIDSMVVVDGGSGYTSATIEVLGDGKGCTATASVVAGKIVSVNIVNPGDGYTWTDIVVRGNGTGAVVRAVMSPIGGHGYNAVDELNANSVMFYSSFSRDINHGLVVNNDYRKAGLLRNIREFGSTKRYNGEIGSGCVLITGSFDKSKLAYDQLLVQSGAEYKKYRIVEFSDTQILVSVFNNFTINPGDVLKTTERIIDPITGVTTEPTNGYNIQVTDVTERDIDQFSGDFLFLTVREPFAPSEEQIITVRTILTI